MLTQSIDGFKFYCSLKTQLQLLIYSSAQYSDDDGAANTKNLGNMSRGGFPVVIHVVFLLDISATLTK